MRAFLLLLALTSSAYADDRFAPGNPTFGDFIQTCRIGQSGIVDECKGGVLDSYAKPLKLTRDQVTCDYSAFWRAADALNTAVIRVIPWQDVVPQVAATTGVCKALGGDAGL